MFINKALIKFAKGSLNKVFRAVLFQFLITFISSITALLTALLINSIITNSDFTEKSLIIIVSIIFSLIVVFILRKKNFQVQISAGVEIKDNVRTKIVQQLFILGPAYNQERTGTLASTFTSRVEWLMMYYTKYLPVAISSIINALIFILFLIRLDVATGLTALISLIMMLVIPMLFFNIMQERGEEEMEWHARYYSECLDGIQGMVTLKALNADDYYIDFIKDLGEKYRKSIMHHMQVTMTEGSLLELFARIGTALTIVILAWNITRNNIQNTYLLFAYFSIGAAFTPMLNLINVWHIGFRGVSGSYYIYDFLNQNPDYVLSNENIPEQLSNRKELKPYLDKKIEIPTSVDIVFKDVSFKYKGEEKYAVKDIDLHLYPGKTVALVGPSGSGKSTIAGLLAGFFPVDKGSLIVNKSEKANCSYLSAVWQDNHLFTGSIYDNIKIGNRNATEEDIFNATKRARIYDLIISLPEGFNTRTQELGSLFSMGERQRIAIARAFLKDAPLFLFDEATSSLDRENERYIQEILKEIKKDKAVLIIAHRLQTIEHADEICFLNDGKIIDRGRHEELLNNSAYSKFIKGILI